MVGEGIKPRLSETRTILSRPALTYTGRVYSPCPTTHLTASGLSLLISKSLTHLGFT